MIKYQKTGAAESSPSRILLAEDDDQTREMLANFLDAKGYQVTTASDGGKALELFNADTFDAVLSDVAMPGMDGFELLNAVKETNPRVPVVLVSGYGNVNMVVKALKAGADDFLAKPLHMEQLYKVVAQALELSCIRPGRHRRLPVFEQRSFMQAPSQPEYIREIIFQIALSAVAVGFTEIDLDNNLRLALVEAITNAMEHGNRWNPEAKVELEVSVSQDLMTVTISDQGPGFDPASLPDPTDTDQLACERGRGVFLMRSILDSLEYNEKGNQVTIQKSRATDNKE